MNQVEQLLHLETRIEQVKKLLAGMDAEVLATIAELQVVERTKTAQAGILKACKTAASFNPFTRNSTRHLDQFKQEVGTLERLSLTIAEENQKFVQARTQQSIGKLQQDISNFLSSYDHFIELYGFALICSEKRLVLGQGLAGELITLPSSERNKHLFMLGKTGSGKSEAMLTYVIQDLIAGRSGCLLDPFGGLARKTAAFVMAYQEIRHSYIELQEQIKHFVQHLFDAVESGVKEIITATLPYEKLSIFLDLCEHDVDSIFPELNATVVDICSKSKNNPYKINPLLPSKSFNIEQSVQVLLDAIAMEMGSSLETTPQAANVLRAIFTLIACNKGNMNDLLLLLNTLRNYNGRGKNSNQLPVAILQPLKSSHEPIANNAADYIEQQLLSFTGNTFNEMINSTRNRLSLLLDSQLCHTIFNSSETNLDLEEIINSTAERKPFLVFHIPHEESGSGIVSHIIFRTMEKILYQRNDQQKQQLFQLYADEFHRFLGGSKHSAGEIADLFTSIRQHGCCLTVAMQNSGQLKKDDPSGYVFSSVVESCHSKIIFQCSGDDAQYFAENQFNDKGQLSEMSYSMTTGEAKVVGSSHSTTQSEGKNQSKGESFSVTESQSKAIGHTVSESFNQVKSQNHTESTNSSAGKSKGQSSSEGQSYFESTRYEDMNHSQNTVISASQNSSYGTGSSNGSGTSEGRSNGSSDSESNSTGHSESTGENHSSGISSSSGKTIGTMESISNNRGFGKTIKRLNHEEETHLYAQEIRRLQARECFIATGSTIKKAITLDSLTIKLEAQLEPFLSDYYQQLFYYQQGDCLRLGSSRVEPKVVKNQDAGDRKKRSEGGDGVGGLF